MKFLQERFAALIIDWESNKNVKKKKKKKKKAGSFRETPSVMLGEGRM